MILVLSYRSYEQGTDPVIEWLRFYEHPFLKLSLEDLINGRKTIYIDEQGNVLFDGINLQKECNAVFYRRFRRNFHHTFEYDLGAISRKICSEVSSEISAMIDYMFYILKDKNWFPFYTSFEVNKEIVNRIANRCGMRTPISIITNNLEEVKRFKKRVKSIVYKPLYGFSYYTTGAYTYSQYTTPIDNEYLKNLQPIFFPSLFQEAIKAKFEIRVFFLDGDFYATAVLISGKNPHVDIKQNFRNPKTHWTPYILPDNIKSKLSEVMKELNLNTGSIDLLYSDNGEYVFLEVNPVGQYLSPSIYCNYNIEKKIALWLIKKDNI